MKIVTLFLVIWAFSLIATTVEKFHTKDKTEILKPAEGIPCPSPEVIKVLLNSNFKKEFQEELKQIKTKCPELKDKNGKM